MRSYDVVPHKGTVMQEGFPCYDVLGGKHLMNGGLATQKTSNTERTLKGCCFHGLSMLVIRKRKELVWVEPSKACTRSYHVKVLQSPKKPWTFWSIYHYLFQYLALWWKHLEHHMVMSSHGNSFSNIGHFVRWIHQLLEVSCHKGIVMLTFDISFVVSLNNCWTNS